MSQAMLQAMFLAPLERDRDGAVGKRRDGASTAQAHWRILVDCLLLAHVDRALTAPQLNGPLAGNVTGNVAGNVTGNVTGNVSGTAGNVTGLCCWPTVGLEHRRQRLRWRILVDCLSLAAR